MLVFVEGVDGSGKSTLCEKLKGLGYDVIRTANYTENDFLEDDYWRRCSDYPLIMDRSPITEFCYRIYDKRISEYKLSTLEYLVDSNKIIYCKTKKSFDNAMQRGEDNITTRQSHKEISRIYDHFMSMMRVFTNVEILEYDWTKNTIDEVVQFIGGTL